MIFLDNLPIDVIELINSNLNNINDKFKLKQISKFFNNTIFIDYNFENKFKLFCEENSYNYSEIDFKTLQLFDKNLNKNIIKIKFNNNTRNEEISTCKAIFVPQTWSDAKALA